MLIEQIIEFELRESGPPSRICTPTTDKTKIYGKSSSGLFFYLLVKCCRRQCTSLPPTWAKSFKKLNAKMQDFIRALDVNCE